MALKIIPKEDCSTRRGPKSTRQRKKRDIPILGTKKKCYICGHEDGNPVDCYNNRGARVKHYLCNDCKERNHV